MVAAMDAVGVDGALLVSPFAMYRYDASYAIGVHAAHPGRFRLIKPVDPADPNVVDTIAEWASTDGAVAIRIMMTQGVSTDAADPGLNRVLAAAARHALPVNLLCWGRLEQAGLLAARNPGTRLVIDHLGLQQPFEPPPPAEPFADLPKLLDLAAHDNIVVKITGGLHAVARSFPLQGLVGPALSHLRRLRLRSLPMGHRLDPGGWVVDVRTRGRGVSRHRPPVRQRQGRSHGWDFATDL